MASETVDKAQATLRFALATEPYSREEGELLSRMMPAGSRLPPLQLFRLLASSARLGAAMEPLGKHLLALGRSPDSGITPRDRELAILTACAHAGCEYEWSIHASFHAVMAGLGQSEIQAAWSGEEPSPPWGERDRLLLQLVAETVHKRGLAEDTWREATRIWTEDDILQLTALVAWYGFVATIVGAAALKPEPWVRPAPDGARQRPHPSQAGGARS